VSGTESRCYLELRFPIFETSLPLYREIHKGIPRTGAVSTQQ